MFSDSMMLGGGRKAAFSIAHSVRLDGVADYFTRTPSTVGNRKTWTFSAWVKRCAIGTQQFLMITGINSNESESVFFDANDKLNLWVGVSNTWVGRVQTNAVFRDTASWGHLVISKDVTTATPKIYWNGIEQPTTVLTEFANIEGYVNTTYEHRIGEGNAAIANGTFNGYITQPTLIDGAALDPSAFGETDPITGSWRPKRYVGPGNLPVYGADVTAGKTVSVSPDLVIDGTNLAPFAIDDNPSTKIATNNAFTANTSRIIIDLGAGGDKAIARITTNQESNYVWTAGKLQYSDDGTSWSDAGSFNPSNSTSTQAFDFPDSGAHRYWALMPTANAYGGSGYGLRFNEIELIELLDSASNFGTNGFHLDFADGADLGKDVSGKGNVWLPVSLGAADVVADTPTNNYATINRLNMQSGLVLSNGNTSANGSAAVRWWRSSLAMSGGKWYFEMKANSANNSYCGIGIEPVVVTRNDGLNQYPGGSEGGADGYGLYTLASPPNQGIRHAHNGVYTDIVDAGFNNASVMKVAVDLDAKMLWLGYDNTWIGGGDPAQGTSPTYTLSAQVSDWVMMGCAYNEVTCYFGASGFNLTVPAGFKALCTANMPKPVIQAPSKHMDVVTYTGTGTSQVVTGLGFQPDLVWCKRRDNIESHGLYDSVRGPTKMLYSDLSNGEATDTNGIVSFNANGFAANGAMATNGSGGNYVAWCWKAGGAAVANTTGSIPSTVSANPTAGFSIAKYAGTGTAGTSFGHGLSAAPKFILVKNISSGNRNANTMDWMVFHTALGNSSQMRLNTTEGKLGPDAGMWNSTAPSTSVVTLGNHERVNYGGDNYIAYCWAEVPGFSKFGSYTGNGSTDGPFVHCGFRPRWLLVKRTDVASWNWRLYDTERDTFNVCDREIAPNVSLAENTGNFSFDIVSNGFKLRSSNGGSNGVDGTYIYAAFAEAPLGGAKTVPAKAR